METPQPLLLSNICRNCRFSNPFYSDRCEKCEVPLVPQPPPSNVAIQYHILSQAVTALAQVNRPPLPPLALLTEPGPSSLILLDSSCALREAA